MGDVESDLGQAEPGRCLPLSSASASAESSVMGPHMGEPCNNFVSSVDHIFRHICNRKVGIVKALTVDVDKFFEECDPEKDNLCLYGLGNGKWVVGLPEEKVPAEFPEPVIGINFARDGMPRKNWLKFVALHSDAWLLGLAAFYAALLHSNERKRLFCMLSDAPSVYDVIIGKGHRNPDRSNDLTLETHLSCRKKFRFNSDTYDELVMNSESYSNDMSNATAISVEQVVGPISPEQVVDPISIEQNSIVFINKAC